MIKVLIYSVWELLCFSCIDFFPLENNNIFSRLRGLLPFDAHDVNAILKNTLKCELSMEDDHWNNISPEGVFY